MREQTNFSYCCLPSLLDPLSSILEPAFRRTLLSRCILLLELLAQPRERDRGIAAVDDDLSARDVARFVGGQKKHGLRDFVRTRRTTERNDALVGLPVARRRAVGHP